LCPLKEKAMRSLEETARALEKNGFDVHLASDPEEARGIALSLIPKGATVGLGGSETVRETGLLEALREGEYDLKDQYEEGIDRVENMRRRRAGLTADFFVTGSNAVTEDGCLVNVDGIGNRVAALAFGPERAIVVVGRNKLVPDVDAGFRRIREVAAPRNAVRFKQNTPCTKDGKCHDCNHPERICNIYQVIRRVRLSGRISVILVDADLGF